MNTTAIVAIVLGTVVLVLVLVAAGVCAFFLIRWLRDLVAALTTISASQNRRPRLTVIGSYR